jgi:hypothetical protein
LDRRGEEHGGEDGAGKQGEMAHGDLGVVGVG